MKSIIITGSEGQLGKVFVERLTQIGYDVIGIDIVEQSNKDIEYHKADITKLDEIKPIIENRADPIYALVNNAGVSVFTPFEERTEEEINWIMDVNVKGNINMTQLLYNCHFKPNQNGNIINIGSVYGTVSTKMELYAPGDRKSPEIYGATKAAVIQLTKYFATYMAKDNVRVNCISPGGVYNNQNESFVNNYSKLVPMNRMANDFELPGVLEFLLSDDSNYITGQNIIVDGGFTAW